MIEGIKISSINSKDHKAEKEQTGGSTVSKMIELTRTKKIPVINKIHDKCFVVTPVTNIKELDNDYLGKIKLDQFEEKDPEIDTYIASVCDKLEKVAKEMIKLAKETGKKIKTEFNGKNIIANTDSTTESIVNDYNNENNLPIKERPVMIGVGLDNKNVYKFDSATTGSIEAAAVKMIELAKKTDGKVVTIFNEHAIMADENSTKESIKADFEKKSNEALEKYYKSDEYKEEKERRKAEDQEDIKESKILMEELPKLDFTNYTKVLDWLCKFEELGNIGNTQPELVKIFMEHGFKPEAEIMNEFNPEDRESVARQIIGIAIGYSSIPQAIHGYAENWKNKFEK